MRDVFFPEKPVSKVRVSDLDEVFGFKVNIDEIIPRFLGGRQVPSNQRVLPANINQSLGPLEYNATKDLLEGTIIQGFDVEFY